MSGPAREDIMAALLALLEGKLKVSFTGDTSASTLISNVSNADSLIVGLAVFGPGVPANTTILSIDTLGKRVVLTQGTTTPGVGLTFTSGFQTFGRRLKPWTEVAAQPALFLRNTGDHYEYPGTVLPRRTLQAEIWVYSKAGQNPDATPGAALNQMVDAIEVALAPDPDTQRLTLGDLVSHCWIEGESVFDPGDLDGQSKALIPVHILVP